MPADLIPWLLWIALAYAIGSIPFGVLIGFARGVDIRAQGSRNIGATNVARVLGRRLGLTCLLLDMLKGALPVLAAGWNRGVLGASITELSAGQLGLWIAVAVSAVLGHCASIFLRLRGGKGVATGFGAILGVWPILTVPAVGALIVWLALRLLTRYVSIASMGAAVSLPITHAISTVITSDDAAADALRSAAGSTAALAALAVFVVWRHRGNLARLRRGEEPRLARRSDRQQGS